jgi:predicted secreted hydrolase
MQASPFARLGQTGRGRIDDDVSHLHNHFVLKIGRTLTEATQALRYLQYDACENENELGPLKNIVKHSLTRFISLLALTLLLAGCLGSERPPLMSANVVAALSGDADAGFARAYEPRPFSFPLDHGAHPKYQTEWWYYTGNLQAANGDAYGFQFTIFRSALTPEMPERTSDFATNQVYMAHFALTDARGGKHHSFERFSRGAANLAGAQGEPSYAVWLEDWSARETEPGVVQIRAHAEGDSGPIAIDLTLTETRPPVLHGDAGLSQKSLEPGNASYYYSLIGLETTGTVTIGNRTAEVTGLSWMDHEFGTSALSEDSVGWDWFSLQLDDGTAIMFAQIRTIDGGRAPGFRGTLVRPDGSQESIDEDDFVLEAQDQWTSPHSGARYPSGWRLSLPQHDVSLTVTPLIRDQEMKVSYVYWEGAVTVEGTIGGEAVTGRGYVELTGYAAQVGEYQR